MSKDIGWEHATPDGGDRRLAKCNYCGKVAHGGITRMKQHLAHISGQVEACPSVPKEVQQMIHKHLVAGKSERAASKKKKVALLDAIGGKETDTIDVDDDDDVCEIDQENLSTLERKQLKQVMKDSRYMAFMKEQQGNY